MVDMEELQADTLNKINIIEMYLDEGDIDKVKRLLEDLAEEVADWLAL